MKISELLQEAAPKAPTPQEQAQIRQYRQEGWNNIEIDELLGKPKNWTSAVIGHYMRDLMQRTLVGNLLTAQDEEEMMDLLKKTKNLRAVGQEFGISDRTVRNRLDARFGKEAVEKWVTKHIPFTEEDITTIKQMYASGVSATSIAAKLRPRRHPAVVTKLLLRLPEPERSELRAQYQANASLEKSPQAATAKVYRAGRMDPTNRGLDWGIGKGYK